MTYFIAETEKSITYKETPPQNAQGDYVATGYFNKEGIFFDAGSRTTPRVLSRVVEQFTSVNGYAPAFYNNAGEVYRLGGWC